MIKINKRKYKVEVYNYYKVIKPKTTIILADSLRRDNYHIKRLDKKEMGKTKTWNTFTIARNGKIFQHYDPKYYSDFVSDKNMSRKSISIVLENLGPLQFDSDSNGYYNWISEQLVDYDCLHVEHWKGFDYWEKYTEEQFKSTVLLCQYLCDKFDIPEKTIGFNNYHVDTVKYDGIITRSNYDDNKYDLNPSFDFMKFKKIISGEWELEK